MVQAGAKSKDIGDIVAIGSDDADDYMAASGGVEASSQSQTEDFDSQGQQSKPAPKVRPMTDDEIKEAMEKMTPRQRKALYH